MDWSTVLTILQDWFAPTGIVVMAIGWWRDRRLTKVRAVSSAERNRGNHLREGPDEDGEPDTGTGTSADDRQPP